MKSRHDGKWWFMLDWPLTVLFWWCAFGLAATVALIVAAAVEG